MYNELDTIEVINTTGMVHEDIHIGDIGTIVMVFDDSNYLVEFSDKEGRTLVMEPLHKDNIKPFNYKHNDADKTN